MYQSLNIRGRDDISHFYDQLFSDLVASITAGDLAHVESVAGDYRISSGTAASRTAPSRTSCPSPS